jgi:hypothetical protein
MTGVERILDYFPAFAPSDFALLFLLQGAIKTIFIAAACLLLFVFVERPCMDPGWPGRLLRYLPHRRTPWHSKTSTVSADQHAREQPLHDVHVPLD